MMLCCDFKGQGTNINGDSKIMNKSAIDALVLKTFIFRSNVCKKHIKNCCRLDLNIC